jgi:hypothetical protein
VKFQSEIKMKLARVKMKARERGRDHRMRARRIMNLSWRQIDQARKYQQVLKQREIDKAFLPTSFCMTSAPIAGLSALATQFAPDCPAPEIGTEIKINFEDEETQRGRRRPGPNCRDRQSGTAEKWQAATDERQEAREVKQAESAASDIVRERKQRTTGGGEEGTRTSAGCTRRGEGERVQRKLCETCRKRHVRVKIEVSR